MKPVMTFVYMKGCGACHDAKPEFDRLAAFARSRIDFRIADIDSVKVDFPVPYTPTLHLSIGGRSFTTDGVRLGGAMTAETMFGWIKQCVVEAKGAKR
jgi:hypothetical protein